MSTFVLVCTLLALPAEPDAASRVAVAAVSLAAGGAVDDTAVREALAARGVLVESRTTSSSLLADAQQVGGACTFDDAQCWSKVGLYAGFDRIVVVAPDALVLVDVATGSVAARAPIANGDVPAAVQALFEPQPVAAPTVEPAVTAPASGAPAHASPATTTTGSVDSATASDISWPAVTTVSAAAVASFCFIAGLTFEAVAVGHLTTLKAGKLDAAAVKEETQAAFDAEHLEIASFVAAGLSGAIAIGAAALWSME